MADHHTRVTPCPWCAEPLDAAMNMGPENEPPKDGDVTVCAYCAGICVIHEGQLRKPTPEEQHTLYGDVGLFRAVAIVKQMIAERD